MKIYEKPIFVIRGGKEMVVPANEVESGDIVFRHGATVALVSDGFMDGDDEECFITTNTGDAWHVCFFVSSPDAVDECFKVPYIQSPDAVDESFLPVFVIRDEKEMVVPANKVERGDIVFRHGARTTVALVADGFMEGDDGECFITTKAGDAERVRFFVSSPNAVDKSFLPCFQ